MAPNPRQTRLHEGIGSRPRPSYLLHGARSCSAFALGEIADELLLASARVEPVRLQETGYAYRHPELEGALKYLLGK